MFQLIRTFLILTIIFLFSTSLFAQAPSTLWTKTFGDSLSHDGGSCVYQTPDEGYIISGSSRNSLSGLTYAWLLKTNSVGDSLWQKKYDFLTVDRPFLRPTLDGAYILLGSSEDYLNGPRDICLVKTNEFGDTLWTKTYGDSGSEIGFMLQQTSDGGYIVLANVLTYAQIYLIKTNSSGDTLWTKRFEASGSNDFIQGSWVIETPDKGYIISGGEKTSANWDGLLIKIDSLGSEVWSKTYGGNKIDFLGPILETPDGGYIIAGATTSFSVGSEDIWLVKTNSSGDTLWTKTYGGTSLDVARYFQPTQDGGYIIVGYTESYSVGFSDDIWLVKTNSSGDTLWTKTYGDSGAEYGRFVQQTSDGAYIITGSTSSFGSGSTADTWLIKTATDPSKIDDNNPRVATKYILSQNYPNPFNPTTTIRFSLPKASFITLKVYNPLGQQVATLIKGQVLAGEHQIKWHAKNLPSGIYIYQLQAGDFVQNKKMILLK